MKNKLKILVLSRGYPSDKYPMYGIFEFDQAKALAKQGHEVIFGVIDTRSIRRFRKLGYETFIKEGIQVAAINWPVGISPSKTIVKINAFAGKSLYKKIVKDFGSPDIIHAHFTHIAYPAIELKKKYGVPVVISEHASRFMEKEIEPWLIDTGNKTYPFVDDAIVVSPSLQNVIKKEFDIESTYIPNIVEVESFEYIPNPNKDEVNFISVGLLINRKRMDLIIESFYEAFQGDPKFKLTIIGDGPERKNLENLVLKYELENQIELTGSLKRKEIGEYMQKSDYFVLPSQAETFGVVYIEAMASGLPVIATRCGGPEHFINESNGILISIDNQQELTQALKDIQKPNYNRKSISLDTKIRYSPETIGKEISDVLVRSFRK